MELLTLKLRTTEVLENLLPVWRVVEATQVRLELSAQNLQRRTLSDTVCTDQTQHLARTGHRQPVQLETVGRVSMGDLGLEVRGQVDDVDGVKGAFLGTDTASDTQSLGDEGDLGRRVYFDAQLAGAHHWAGLFAFLSTFLGRVSRLARGKERGRVALALGLHCHGAHGWLAMAKFCAWRGSGVPCLS